MGVGVSSVMAMGAAPWGVRVMSAKVPNGPASGDGTFPNASVVGVPSTRKVTEPVPLSDSPKAVMGRSATAEGGP
jgi:hypothetical protein